MSGTAELDRGKRNTAWSDRERLCWKRVFFCALNSFVFSVPERLVFCHGNHRSAKVHGNATCKGGKSIIPAQVTTTALSAKLFKYFVVCDAWVTFLHFQQVMNIVSETSHTHGSWPMIMIILEPKISQTHSFFSWDKTPE